MASFLPLGEAGGRRGVVWAYPDGSRNERGEQFWNATDACCAFGSDVDDVAYLTGLIDEIVWTKMFGLVFGSTAWAVAVVLAAFMGGLALGGALIGSRADRSPDLLGLYMKLEIGVGLSAARRAARPLPRDHARPAGAR